MKTSIAIIGSGPTGLLLGQLLHTRGIENFILESQSKDHVLGLKESGAAEHPVIVTIGELCGRLDATYPEWAFSNDELSTAVDHLETYGYVKWLRTSQSERRILLDIAPHLVRPLPFVFPVHRGDRVPLWKLWAGIWVYDLLAAFRNVRWHTVLGKRGLLRREPMPVSYRAPS